MNNRIRRSPRNMRRTAHVGMWLLCTCIIAFLSCSPPLHAQSLAVPPVPQYPETGWVRIDFRGEGTVNLPQGDNTVLMSSLSVRKGARFRVVGLDGVLGGVVDVGVSFRDDTNDMSLRIEQNQLRVGTVLTLPVGWKVNPYVSGSLETTPTEKFLYGPGGPVRVAKFWDPVISTESAGASVLHSGESLTVAARVGIALEQIRTAVHTDRTDDRETEGELERYRGSSGIELAGDARLQLDSNGVLESRLALYGSFEDLTTWRVLSENRITVSFAELFAFTWEVNLTHDVTQTLRTQVRSGMAVGGEVRW